MHLPFIFIVMPAVLGVMIALGFASERVDDRSIDLPEADADSLPAVEDTARRNAVDDARIAVAIKNKLARVGQRAFASIEVSVKDGVATLKGTADNLWTQQRASEFAQVIRGVRGVIDRISVGPVETTKDSVIKKYLEYLLIEDPVVELKDVHIAVKRGVVTLGGQVQSWQERQSVLNVAKMVKGVRAVRDAMTIQHVKGRSDSVIRKEIVRRFEFDVWVERPKLVTVHVKEGTVTLSGRVRSAYEKRRVVELARVAGVRKVNSDGVQVVEEAHDPMIRSHRPMPTDQAISEAIQRVLAYDPRVASFNIQVSVKHGSVTLQGAVPFLSVKRDAEEDILHTVGVRGVNNQLTVTTSSTFSDQGVRTRILKAFTHDPVLENFSLAVEVRKGTVLLTGKVDSIYERNRAENVSSKIRGVQALENQIVFATKENEKADGDIQLDIENQVWWNPYLSEQDIVATVKDGKAILSGSVDHAPYRVIAEQQAFEAGASAVENRLKVRKRSSLPQS